MHSLMILVNLCELKWWMGVLYGVESVRVLYRSNLHHIKLFHFCQRWNAIRSNCLSYCIDINSIHSAEKHRMHASCVLSTICLLKRNDSDTKLEQSTIQRHKRQNRTESTAQSIVNIHKCGTYYSKLHLRRLSWNSWALKRLKSMIQRQ